MLDALDKRKPGILRVKNSAGTYDGIPAGVLLIGDVFDCRDPITGAGMTAALNDVTYWRDALRGIQLGKDTNSRVNGNYFISEDQNFALPSRVY